MHLEATFLSFICGARIWVLLSQRLLPGKLTWDNPPDHFTSFPKLNVGLSGWGVNLAPPLWAANWCSKWLNNQFLGFRMPPWLYRHILSWDHVKAKITNGVLQPSLRSSALHGQIWNLWRQKFACHKASFLRFSMVKIHFLQKVLKKWSSFRKKNKIFFSITGGGGQDPIWNFP